MSDKVYAYHLCPVSPLHLGVEGIGQERIEDLPHSDTLFGALLQCWMLIFDVDPDDLVNKPPFRLTSCFPLIGKRRFFPLPEAALDEVMSESPSHQLKKWKKVRFVEESLFDAWIRGAPFPAGGKPSGPYLHSGPGFENLIPADLQVPRLGIDPLSGTAVDAAFFYCTNRYFPKATGLFFLASFNEAEWKQPFETALRLLADIGLGGDRSVGRGSFTWQVTEVSLPESAQPSGWVTLSLWHPTPKEVANGLLQRSHYAVIRRHGYVAGFGARSLRRKALMFLREGAVVKDKTQPVGDSPLVLEKRGSFPSFNVYRYGFAFALGFAGGGRNGK
jgi:CRISPR-associated protein Csm4